MLPATLVEETCDAAARRGPEHEVRGAVDEVRQMARLAAEERENLR